MATTASGGLHLCYAAARPYRNLTAIGGAGVDCRSLGGYVVLPADANGRTWLRPLIGEDGVMAPRLPAPAWLDCAQRKEPSPRMPLVLAPSSAMAPASADPWAQRKALAQLDRACAKVAAAECGSRDVTRHRECYIVGGIVSRGDIDYATAYTALLEASLVMQARGNSWPDLERRVARSLEAGMAAPLPLSPNEQWVRDFRARMRLMRPSARHG